jgi:hypothetical protein
LRAGGLNGFRGQEGKQIWQEVDIGARKRTHNIHGRSAPDLAGTETLEFVSSSSSMVNSGAICGYWWARRGCAAAGSAAAFVRLGF